MLHIAENSRRSTRYNLNGAIFMSLGAVLIQCQCNTIFWSENNLNLLFFSWVAQSLPLKFLTCFSLQYYPEIRSSRPEVFIEKGVRRNFAKSTGKHLCQSLISIKLQASALQLYQKRSSAIRCFPVNFAKFPRTPLFTEQLWWLLFGFSVCNGSTKFVLSDGKRIHYFQSIAVTNISKKS